MTFLNRFHLVHVKRLGEALIQLGEKLPPSGKNRESTAPRNHAFDIILLDLTLPDSTGLASLDLLIDRVPSLPIVVLTNTNDDELAVEAVRHGAQDYLVKRHLNQEILARSLRYAIERKQAAVALREANEILELRVQERTAELETTNQLLKQEIEWRQRIQQRLELAQKAAKIGTFEWNIQSNQFTWTVELEALYGFKPGSFDSQYEQWIQTLHSEDRPKVEQELAQAVLDGQGLDTEFRIIDGHGETRWIAVKSSLFRDDYGNPLQMTGIHMDITEKKQLEAQFLRAQRLESLGTLASGIAHDLNNILTPILTGVQLLQLKFPYLNDQTQQMLKMLETSAQRGAQLIRQILSFARSVEGKRVSLQIHHLLIEIETIIQQTLPKSIEIQIDSAADLWTVSGDATQLHQVLMNLCVNARDAMPNGGTLSMTARNLILDESSARKHLDAKVGPYVRVTISDTGIGIPQEIQERIFDPFFTTKEVGKGTGLGLSAVLGIIKSHGGFVDVQSEVNQGSQFHLYLPASQSAAIPPADELEPLLGQQELILVVDDEAMICETTKTILEAYNYQVLTANDGVEAIALYAEHQEEIYCVLMDIMMPLMDGPSILPLLRRLNPDVYAIAMSGLNSKEAVKQLQQLGFQDFLPKPFSTQDLLQALHQKAETQRF
ncbi:response regulator [Desertifilum sp. FACHB-1129]|nr:response regulator [Desertifilum sp. FACHB-1129]MBD2322757.1 response regulator [Desertifilum sp. FACHB-866]MBD2332849.1 response regulator [Desertifilum sp. FACHB-868]